MRMHRPEDEDPQLNLTAFIDCLMLMLMFFLISATIRKHHNELPIDLPASGNAQVAKAPDSTLIITLFKAKGDQIQYGFSTMGETMTGSGGDREVVSWQQLINKIKDAAATNVNRNVRIDADQAVPWGKIAQVVDHLELYRLRKIGFRTRDNTGAAGGG